MIFKLKIFTIIAITSLILSCSMNFSDMFTITFHTNGGSGSIIKQVVKAREVVKLEDVKYTYEGHVFSGWSLKPTSGIEYSDGSTILINNDIDLYAQWEKVKYKVYLDTQGGEALSLEYIEVCYNSIYFILPIPEKKGYVFGGWWTSANGGNKISFNSYIIENKEHSLYAHWISETIVSFETNGGLIDEPTTISTGIGLEYGELPIPSKDKYLFVGWKKSSGDFVTKDSIVGISEDHILYADWAKEIRITFNYSGGSDGDIISKVVGEGLEYGFLPTSTKEGYTFGGWWIRGTNDKRIDKNSKVNDSENHTLYAQWNPNTYTIRFDPQGGSTPSLTSIEVVYNKTIGKVPSSEKENQILIGWYTEIDGNGIKIDEDYIYHLNSNLKVYAYWNFPVKSGPAGGYIFYDKGYYSEGWRYLEAAPTDLGGGMQWGAYGYFTHNSANKKIGSGLENSLNIVNFHDNLEKLYPDKFDFYIYPNNYSLNSDGSVAAKSCLEYEIKYSGKIINDWYLPSLDELIQMYKILTRQGLGDFYFNFPYWSSTEMSAIAAYRVSLYDGKVSGDSWGARKSRIGLVRPIRRF